MSHLTTPHGVVEEERRDTSVERGVDGTERYSTSGVRCSGGKQKQETG